MVYPMQKKVDADGSSGQNFEYSASSGLRMRYASYLSDEER